jgi:anaerobic ribonucleoside-triphosphate reductase activating protein
MKISGLQKLSLIDYPDKIVCTLFLFGCNFRCGFCHNPELVLTPNGIEYSEKEILDFLEKRKEQLEGVCITGGEPLLTLEKDFLEKIKDLGYSVKIDTNGTNPEKLKEFISENLVDYVAMDLKASPEKYNLVAGTNVEMNKLEETIKLMVKSGIDYEFRTTIIKRYHDEEELEKMYEWVLKLVGKKPKRYFLQGFANHGKFIENNFNDEPNVFGDYLKKFKPLAEKYFEEVGIRE